MAVCSPILRKPRHWNYSNGLINIISLQGYEKDPKNLVTDNKFLMWHYDKKGFTGSSGCPTVKLLTLNEFFEKLWKIANI